MPVRALFGGSFDPFHNGHLWLVDAVLEHTAASQVWVMPAATPPHKAAGTMTDFALRLEMCHLAAQGRTDIVVSDLEARREGPSYTVDTLQALRAVNGPAVEWLLLLGADMAADFANWRDPEGILAIATVVVAGRPGEGAPPAIAGAIALPGTPPDISATEVRASVRAGKAITDWVPAPVAQFIGRHSLYAC